MPSRAPQVRERIHMTETMHSVIHKHGPILYVSEPIPIICMLTDIVNQYLFVTLEHKTSSLKSLVYICSNSQKYMV